jgi:CheY-like chemotaxis protein
MSTSYGSALIVDDNWYNRDIFRIALESAEYAVVEAETGEDGLEKLGAETYDLLILDLQMPGIGGKEVLETLRQDPRHSQMRVVVVTANAHMATEVVDELADHIMYKPVDVLAFAEFTERLKHRKTATLKNVADIARLERLNYEATLPIAALTAGYEVVLRDDVILSSSQLFPSPDTTHACQLQTTVEGADSLITEITGYYTLKELPTNIVISPACTPPDLANRLLKHGFKKQDAEEVWLILDQLEDYKFMPDLKPAEMVKVDLDNAETFARIFLECFEQPLDFAEGLVELLKPSMSLPQTSHFLVKADERFVGTMSLIKHQEFGIVGSAGVLAEYRDKRLGVEFFMAVHAEAARQGIRTLILQTAVGSKVDQHLPQHGFRRAFTRQTYSLNPKG